MHFLPLSLARALVSCLSFDADSFSPCPYSSQKENWSPKLATAPFIRLFRDSTVCNERIRSFVCLLDRGDFGNEYFFYICHCCCRLEILLLREGDC